MKRVSILAVIVLGCGGRSVPAPAPTSSGAGSSVEDQRRLTSMMPCDPMSGREPAPPPPDPGAVCGNGVVEALAGTCEKVCAGGCDGPVECRVECTEPREICDGADVTYSCESQGYAGGAMRCTAACELDDGACVACVPGPGTRCGASRLAGDEVFAVAGPQGAAGFARDAETGRLTGARVDAKLGTKPFARLPTGTLAAGALDGALGFVDAQRRFGVIDARSGRARVLGPIGADSAPILILRESRGRGGAAVLTGDYQRRTLAIFDAPGATASGEPRHFALDNLRVVVVPGEHALARGVTANGAPLVVIAFGGEIYAYQQDGLELTRLPAVPAGVTLAFSYPFYTDALVWPSGQLTIRARTSPDASAPPAGLSRAALSGSSAARAFGGVLFVAAAHAHRPIELYWTTADLIAADPPASAPAP